MLTQIDGKNRTLRLSFRYHSIIDKWMMTISDAQTGKDIVTNIPVLGSKILANDLVSQFRHLGLGSIWAASYERDLAGQTPSIDNLSKFELIVGDALG